MLSPEFTAGFSALTRSRQKETLRFHVDMHTLGVRVSIPRMMRWRPSKYQRKALKDPEELVVATPRLQLLVPALAPGLLLNGEVQYEEIPSSTLKVLADIIVNNGIHCVCKVKGGFGKINEKESWR